ncbi:MAG: hypothetical protein E3J83_05255 [Candidatus Atribacteria bacterium]|nr:MAG: hypothetical protein E3J83_05255 [Candidatus Atribacteria bacterium]
MKDLNTNEVFILGTGFSKAIYKEMPLINELSIEIEKKLYQKKKIIPEFVNIYDKYISRQNFKNFEDILTYLYQNFPWKNLDEYYLLRSLFYYITNLLVEIFLEKEEEFKVLLLKKNDKDNNLKLLKRFINYLNFTNSNIITFNYDTILEFLCINVFNIKTIINRYSNIYDSQVDINNIVILKDFRCEFTNSEKIIDIKVNKLEKRLEIFYYDYPIPDDLKQFLEDYYNKYFKSEFGDTYRTLFIGVYSEYYSENVQRAKNRIELEDLYHLPFTRVERRTANIWGGTQFRTTLRLYKLHGSINLYYSPDSGEGSTIYIRSGDPKLKKLGDISTKDLQPLIMPPLLDKSSFLKINTIKTVWQESRKVLSEAKKIYIIGYSIPDSDLTVKLMLKTHTKNCSEIYLININREVEEKIKKVFEMEDSSKEDIVINDDNTKTISFRVKINGRLIRIIGFYPKDEINDTAKEKIFFKFINSYIPSFN